MSIADKFEKPDAELAATAGIAIGAVVLLVVLARVFRDVAPA